MIVFLYKIQNRYNLQILFINKLLLIDYIVSFPSLLCNRHNNNNFNNNNNNHNKQG